MSDDEKPRDPLGIKPYGEALNKAVDGVVAFLGQICLRAAEG